ncbi:unnamed protein product [Polarella glacialis]|uniref:PDZ domain-containing protein n=1 Tax=Polarella glacialis TaxID=89957 RepID=A0A813GUU5_POLGL|nr:unnamed protein product [Polarella glacialis]|eukprot:CAMPEP_0115120324 /NCGR_PEP_ID=MMETSP0227-20121206/45619_1 /TAXON_ID=89957 /ORGANISM="Polarella glacialis, Strain CCMP 1383" /LENGTH=287 /DNA_ID=CAMNT_0002521963 /DNA_START=74 /DNA_END=937 /DNA_ORIENTATION=-
MFSYFFGPCCNQDHSSTAVVLEDISSSEDEAPEFSNSEGPNLAGLAATHVITSAHPLSFMLDQKGCEGDSDAETLTPRDGQSSYSSRFLEAGYYSPFPLLEDIAPDPADFEPPAFVEMPTYVVQIRKKEDDNLGLIFDITDANLPVISRIKPDSLAFEWNLTCPESQVIRSMDRLVMVNGMGGRLCELVAKLMEVGDFEITLGHPQEFTVTIHKDARGLGLLLEPTESFGLFVSEVLNNDTKGIKATDRIVAVNGKVGNCQELFELIKGSDDLELSIISFSAESDPR